MNVICGKFCKDISVEKLALLDVRFHPAFSVLPYIHSEYIQFAVYNIDTHARIESASQLRRSYTHTYVYRQKCGAQRDIYFNVTNIKIVPNNQTTF